MFEQLNPQNYSHFCKTVFKRFKTEKKRKKNFPISNPF